MFCVLVVSSTIFRFQRDRKFESGNTTIGDKSLRVFTFYEFFDLRISRKIYSLWHIAIRVRDTSETVRTTRIAHLHDVADQADKIRWRSVNFHVLSGDPDVPRHVPW